MSHPSTQRLSQPPPAIDLELIKAWLKQAGEIALARRDNLDTNLKKDGTPVTTADHDVETFLIERISGHYPHHRIITEEGGIYAGDGEFVWVIDPIDGTRAYASGLPIWGISIGVLRRSQPYLGTFYLPALGELYWGSSRGAFCNSRPLARQAGLSFDNPLAFMAVPSNAHRVYHINFPRLRSLGSVAAHLIYVARGAALGAVTRRIKIWDIAGVLPILDQTGSVLSYLSGRPFQAAELLDGQLTPEPLVVAAHAGLLEPVRACFQPKS